MRIHIIGSTHQTASLDTLRGILDLLTTDSADEVTIDSRFFSYLMQHEIAPSGVKTYPLSGTIDTDLMVCIGGDGTFLRGAKLVAGTEAGIIGLNSGHLGSSLVCSLISSPLIGMRYDPGGLRWTSEPRWRLSSPTLPGRSFTKGSH